MLKEFKEFLLRTNALALAVGVIIGAAVGGVVNSLVKDVLMPVIGLLVPGGAWEKASILLLKKKLDGTAADPIVYGSFFGAVINFVIIAFVVFMITRALLKPAPAPPAPPTKECPFCKETIPAAASKCKACASNV
jgi:large conductance mechanosensitive channel